MSTNILADKALDYAKQMDSQKLEVIPDIELERPFPTNAMGILANAWPVVIPPGPGVLCAYGDATTTVQDEATRTYIKMADKTTVKQLLADLKVLKARAAESLIADGIEQDELEVVYQADLRYAGQAFSLTLDFSEAELDAEGMGKSK